MSRGILEGVWTMSTTDVRRQGMSALLSDLNQRRAALSGEDYVTAAELRAAFGLSDETIAKMKRSAPDTGCQTADS